MPRPAIDAFWRERIDAITANNPKWGPGRVLRALEQVGEREGRRDWPAERTIGREQQRFRDLDPARQRDYLVFHWPASMERGDLPWEAARVGLSLIDSAVHGGRPLVRDVRWCWRITLARPDAPLSERWRAACCMGANEAAPDEYRHIPPRIEAWLRGDDAALEGISIPVHLGPLIAHGTGHATATLS